MRVDLTPLYAVPEISGARRPGGPFVARRLARSIHRFGSVVRCSWLRLVDKERNPLLLAGPVINLPCMSYCTRQVLAENDRPYSKQVQAKVSVTELQYLDEATECTVSLVQHAVAEPGNKVILQASSGAAAAQQPQIAEINGKGQPWRCRRLKVRMPLMRLQASRVGARPGWPMGSPDRQPPCGRLAFRLQAMDGDPRRQAGAQGTGCLRGG